MSQLRTTLGTAGAAALLAVAAFAAGASGAGTPASDGVPLEGAVSLADEESDDELREELADDDIGIQAVPGLGQAELLYVPIAPCRVVDTRGGTGSNGTPFSSGTARSYYVGGTVGFPQQGGRPGGCGIPESAMAVSVTVLAYEPGGSGRLKAWPHGTAEPNANVQYYGSTSLGTGATLPLTAGSGRDLRIRNFNTSTDVLLDVTGYYVPQLYAYLDPSGSLIDHSGRVVSSERTSVGSYTITWDRNVGSCVGVASSDLTGYIVSVYTDGNSSYVRVDDNAGTAADYYVNVSLHC
jgi:hypothetical protein